MATDERDIRRAYGDHFKQFGRGHTDIYPAIRREVEALEDAYEEHTDDLTSDEKFQLWLAARAALNRRVEELVATAYHGQWNGEASVCSECLRKARKLLNEEPDE